VSTPTRALAAHRRGIGYVPQSAALFPTRSVRENVAYGLHALPRRARAERTATVLEALGLAQLAGRSPHELSGGQARRVALARALAPAPARLLLDEPLTNLDADARAELLDAIDLAVRDSGASLLYVTHEPSEAERLDARIVAMTP
jgi:ABC-type Fe3+/spermidine/putrescine transport system ATPase subunit